MGMGDTDDPRLDEPPDAWARGRDGDGNLMPVCLARHVLHFWNGTVREYESVTFTQGVHELRFTQVGSDGRPHEVHVPLGAVAYWHEGDCDECVSPGR